MAEKMWYEKTWDELNQVRLVNIIKDWSDSRDFSSWKPSEDEIEQYRMMYEKAKRIEPNNYTLLGCVKPEYFGKKSLSSE